MATGRGGARDGEIRNDLQHLRLGKKFQRGIDFGSNAEVDHLLDATKDTEDAKTKLVEMILDTRANMSRRQKAASMKRQQTLETLTLGQLYKKARRVSTSQTKLERALDSDDPKAAMIRMLLHQKKNGLLSLDIELHEASEYNWFRTTTGSTKPSLKSQWRAYWLHYATLQEHEEELNMALDMFQRAAEQHRFTIFDVISFSEFDRDCHYQYCIALVNAAELAILQPELLLDLKHAGRFQVFMHTMLDIFSEHTTEDGKLDIGDGKERCIPRMFASKKGCEMAYKNEGVEYTTKHLPYRKFLEDCDYNAQTPFRDIYQVPVTERLIVHAAFVQWGLKGHAAVLRMCLTADQIVWGEATDNEDGARVGKC